MHKIKYICILMLSQTITEFSDTTQHICLCTGIAVIFILLFIASPFNTILLPSIFGKLVILTLLGYILFINFQQTNKYSKLTNIWHEGEGWNPLKTNILASYVFSLTLLVLFVSIAFK